MEKYFIISKENLQKREKIMSTSEDIHYYYQFNGNSFTPNMEKVCGLEITKEEFLNLSKSRSGNHINSFEIFEVGELFTPDMVEIVRLPKIVGKFKIRERC